MPDEEVMPEFKTQFLCSDVSKFIKEMQELIDKHTSDSSFGLDVSVEVKSYS